VRHFSSSQTIGWLVLHIVPALVLPLMAGLLLDWWLGSSPLWAAVGASAGSLVAAQAVYRRMVRRFDTYLPTADDEDEAEVDVWT
jgi:hypothetical protein